MAEAAERAGVVIVGGDTKVVEHGKADRMYITTDGHRPPHSGLIVSARVPFAPGDKVLLSGPIGDHGITILLARGELDLEADLCSDTRSVSSYGRSAGCSGWPGVRWMRDPTRGGVATSSERTCARLRAGRAFSEECDSRARCGARRLRIARAGSAAHRQ